MGEAKLKNETFYLFQQTETYERCNLPERGKQNKTQGTCSVLWVAKTSLLEVESPTEGLTDPGPESVPDPGLISALALDQESVFRKRFPASTSKCSHERAQHHDTDRWSLRRFGFSECSSKTYFAFVVRQRSLGLEASDPRDS